MGVYLYRKQLPFLTCGTVATGKCVGGRSLRRRVGKEVPGVEGEERTSIRTGRYLTGARRYTASADFTGERK